MNHPHAESAQTHSPVVIYTTPTCGYCRAAKHLLQEKGLEFTEVDLTAKPASVREELMARTSHRTVPMIFVNEFFIGGYDQLYAMNASGEFDELYEKELAQNETKHD